MGHFFLESPKMKCFSRPKRPYEGQLIDLLAFVQKYFWKFYETFKKVANFWKKKVQKNLYQGQQPLFHLSASWSIFSGVAHLIYTKFKSYGWFYSSFKFMKFFWPLKASKAYKDHLSFCCLSLGNKNSLQSEYFLKICIFCFCEI